MTEWLQSWLPVFRERDELAARVAFLQSLVESRTQAITEQAKKYSETLATRERDLHTMRGLLNRRSDMLDRVYYDLQTALDNAGQLRKEWHARQADLPP